MDAVAERTESIGRGRRDARFSVSNERVSFRTAAFAVLRRRTDYCSRRAVRIVLRFGYEAEARHVWGRFELIDSISGRVRENNREDGDADVFHGRD